MASFWAPLKSTTPKWWLITALLIIDTFVSLFALQFLTSAISFIAMILIGGLICFFLYCLYFKLFEKWKSLEKYFVVKTMNSIRLEYDGVWWYKAICVSLRTNLFFLVNATKYFSNKVKVGVLDISRVVGRRNDNYGRRGCWSRINFTAFDSRYTKGFLS